MDKLTRLASLMLVSSLLAGCATKPADPEFGYQSDGSYKLSPPEQSKPCSVLTKDIQGEIPAIAAYERQALQGKVLTGVIFVAAVATRAGTAVPNFGHEPDKNAKRLRARVDAHNDHLLVKGCARLDVDALIASEKQRQAQAEPAPEAKVQ